MEQVSRSGNAKSRVLGSCSSNMQTKLWKPISRPVRTHRFQQCGKQPVPQHRSGSELPVRPLKEVGAQLLLRMSLGAQRLYNYCINCMDLSNLFSHSSKVYKFKVKVLVVWVLEDLWENPLYAWLLNSGGPNNSWHSLFSLWSPNSSLTLWLHITTSLVCISTLIFSKGTFCWL